MIQKSNLIQIFQFDPKIQFDPKVQFDPKIQFDLKNSIGRKLQKFRESLFTIMRIPADLTSI